VLDSDLDSRGIIQGCRKAEVEVISRAGGIALRGPADHDKFLAVEAFDLEPDAEPRDIVYRPQRRAQDDQT
jgi:hypothetical protein